MRANQKKDMFSRRLAAPAPRSSAEAAAAGAAAVEAAGASAAAAAAASAASAAANGAVFAVAGDGAGLPSDNTLFLTMQGMIADIVNRDDVTLRALRIRCAEMLSVDPGLLEPKAPLTLP